MAAPPPTVCPNCGAQRPSAFCADCGQAARESRRDLRSLVGELIGSLFAVDGRVWTTARRLFLRPGALTRAWIEGRRAAHMAPLRVFLFFSILLFLVIQSRSSTLDILLGEKAEVPIRVTEEEAGAADRSAFDLSLPSFWPFTAIAARLAEQESRFERLDRDEQAYVLTRRALELAPLALLLLLPLMAAFLKLWWLGTGAFFVDHLVFLMHAYAFVCATAAVLLLARFPDWANAAAVGIGYPLYFHRAARVAYARGFWRTAFGTIAGAGVTLLAAILVILILLPYGLLTF